MLNRLYRYAAPYCRLRAMKAGLLRNEDYGSLLRTPDVEGIHGYLLHLGYADVLQEVSAVSAAGLERALRAELIRSCEKVLRFMGGKPSRLVQILIQYFDLLNVKTAIRNLCRVGLKEEEVTSLLFDTGRWGLLRKSDLAAVSDFPALGALLRPTFLFRGYEAALRQYQVDEEVFSFESALELSYFGYLWERVRALGGLDRSYGAEILKTYGDTKSVIWFLRLRFVRQMEVHSIVNYLLLFGGESAALPFTEVLSMESEREAFEQLAEGLLPRFRRFYREIPDSFSLRWAEWVLTRYFLDGCRRIFRRFPFQIGAFLSYYFLKQAEIQDLITIVEGKALALPEERISGFLVSPVTRIA